MTIERCHKCLANPVCDDALSPSCLPVPYFGGLNNPNLKVVTIGLNPALNEFVVNGTMKNRAERLPMLVDFGCQQRTNLTDGDIAEAKKRRDNYFQDHQRGWHPYFEKMESVLTRVKPTWTYAFGSACHIDVVACATNERWGKLSNQCQRSMITNCREHFESAISALPSGTVILCDGPSATREIADLDKNASLHQTLINVRIPRQGDKRWIGDIEVKGKKFPVRGWSSQVTHLSAIWRIDLASWIHNTFEPTNSWPPLQAQQPNTPNNPIQEDILKGSK